MGDLWSRCPDLLHICVSSPSSAYSQPVTGSGVLLCRGANSFVQLALNLRSGDRSAVKFVECAALDAVAAMRRLLAHRACNVHPNIVQLQVGTCCAERRLRCAIPMICWQC